MPASLVVVLDTMVVIRGVVGRRGGADARVLRAVATGEVQLATSDEGLREIAKVIGYDDVKAKMKEPVRVFKAGLDIGIMGRMYRPRKLDWPSLRDPKDG